MATIARMPDAWFAEGRTSAGGPVVRVETGRAATAAELERLGEPAPFGRGTQTVVDAAVRRTLKVDLSRVAVEWAGLDAAVAEARRALTLPLELTAQLHSVLVYRPGDFFTMHVDAKKSERHIATMAVDCGLESHRGGELRFHTHAALSAGAAANASRKRDRFDGPIVGVRNEKGDAAPEHSQATVLGEWKSCGAGHWCAWFATELHEVRPVTAGRRVVVTYNLLAADEEAPVAVASPRIDAVTTTALGAERRSSSGDSSQPGRMPNRSHGTVAAETGFLPFLALHAVAAFCDVKSLARLSATCGTVRRAVGSQVDLAAAWLKTVKQDVHRLCELSRARNDYDRSEENRCHSIGLVLRHRYSFDGNKSGVPAFNLRGLDAVLVAAAERVFGGDAVQTTPCDLLIEEETADYADEIAAIIASANRSANPAHWRDDYHEPVDVIGIAHDTIFQAPSDDDASVGPTAATGATTCAHYSPWHEVDDGVPLRSKPFEGVFFVNSAQDLKKHHQIARCHRDLGTNWGNQATFELFWYKDTALMVRVEAVDGATKYCARIQHVIAQHPPLRRPSPRGYGRY